MDVLKIVLRKNHGNFMNIEFKIFFSVLGALTCFMLIIVALNLPLQLTTIQNSLDIIKEKLKIEETKSTGDR
jgi:hypothetical protein